MTPGTIGPASRIAADVEAAFISSQESVQQRLAVMEAAAAADVERPAADGIREQAAFLRVGLRCLADAIAELLVNAAELDAQSNPANQRPDSERPTA